VVCLYLDVVVGGFRWGMTLGVGYALLMRGGACVSELCLMVGWGFVVVSLWFGWSSCGLWECVFRFLMLGVVFTLRGLSLYGFGVGFMVSVG